jgi:hypothetical protein
MTSDRQFPRSLFLYSTVAAPEAIRWLACVDDSFAIEDSDKFGGNTPVGALHPPLKLNV